MELDEFKAHWNTIQDKEFQQQKISPLKLKQIIMNTTETMSQLYAKSIYWKKFGNISIGIVALCLIIIFIKTFYLHSTNNTAFETMRVSIVTTIYCIAMIWTFKRQEQIFIIDNSKNIKESIEQTITAFNRFYLKMNIIFLFLYPALFYSAIKYKGYWCSSPQTIWLAVTIATVISLALGHWYYKIKFFKKLKSLEANLKDL